MKRKRYFNMIEIAIAMAVAGAGITLILALFPIAVKSAKSSMEDSYIPIIASTFVTQLNAIADAQTTDFDKEGNWLNTLPDVGDASIPMMFIDPDDLEPKSSGITYLGNTNRDPVDENMSLYSYRSGGKHQGFIVVFKSYNADTEKYDIVDFAAAVTIEKASVSDLGSELYVYRSNAKNIDPQKLTNTELDALGEKFMRLILTVQWPLEASPGGRSTRTYIVEKVKVN